MRYITRSSYATSTKCRRKGYWGYLYGGTGLDGTSLEWNLIMGLTVHKGMEHLLRSNGDIEVAIRAAQAEWAERTSGAPDSFDVRQRLSICMSQLRAWHRVRWPLFARDFEILSIEKEVRAQLAPNITLLGRADAVVRRRDDRTVWVINWKTTGSMKDWDQQWEDDIQSMTEALLTQEDLGEMVMGCLFEGFYKGGLYKNVSTSPLVTGYRNLYDRNLWAHEAPSKRSEWEKASVWDQEDMDLERWVQWLPEDVVAEQFIRSSPMLKNDERVREWLKQVIRRETDTEYMLGEEIPEEDKLIYFEQNLGWNCRWCQFRPACRLETDIQGLMESGQLRKRVDHHAGVEEVEG